MGEQQFSGYRDVVVRRPGWRFSRYYALLRASFGEAELEGEPRYRRALRAVQDRRNRTPPIIVGRFGLPRQRSPWRKELPVSVGVVSGTYLSLRDLGRRGQGVGALGHMVTHPTLGRGRGHGTALLHAFEREVAQAATRRRERLRLIVLESQPEARGFWAKQGYRYLEGVRYAQPPLEFDPGTGEPLHEPVPETLMVRVWGEPEATEVDAALLRDAVRAVYRAWYLPPTGDYAPEVTARIEAYIFGRLFEEFAASRPAAGGPVKLVAAPAALTPAGQRAAASPGIGRGGTDQG